MTSETAEMIQSIDERWSNLTIANDFVFCKTMLNTDLCREVLETILGVPIERIEYVGRHEQLDASPEGKSVCLDVYVRDEAGTVYNVEMQTTDTRELPRRSRYYHALMAVDQLTKGSPYNALKDTYVIFICRFDAFKLGRRVYYFENTCRGDDRLTLGDGTKTIFLSATAPKQKPAEGRLDEFLDYVASGTVAGELSAKLAAEVASVLDNQKWRLEYMMLEVRDQLNFDRGVLQGRAEGLAQGLAQGKEQGLAEGIAQGKEQGLAEGLAQGKEAGLAEGLAQGKEQGLTEGLAQGREAGLAEGLAQGKEQGRSEGMAEGEERLAKLLATLISDGRKDEVAQAVLDPAAREGLYRSYGIGR